MVEFEKSPNAGRADVLVRRKRAKLTSGFGAGVLGSSRFALIADGDVRAPSDGITETKPLGRIPKNGKEMTDGSGDDKEMPGEMCVADAVRGEKNNARGIGDASRQQPRQPG
jgi:hypothetical protein